MAFPMTPHFLSNKIGEGSLYLLPSLTLHLPPKATIRQGSAGQDRAQGGDLLLSAHWHFSP